MACRCHERNLVHEKGYIMSGSEKYNKWICQSKETFNVYDRFWNTRGLQENALKLEGLNEINSLTYEKSISCNKKTRTPFPVERYYHSFFTAKRA